MRSIKQPKQKEKDMSTTQAMRCRRRAARVAQERRERCEMAAGIAALVFMLLAFAIAGTMDYQDEKAQAEFWLAQGIELQEW